MTAYPLYLHVLPPLFPTRRSSVLEGEAPAPIERREGVADAGEHRLQPFPGRLRLHAQGLLPPRRLPQAAVGRPQILGLKAGRPVARRRFELRRRSGRRRSEEHTSELQSLMRISYAVFCLKK